MRKEREVYGRSRRHREFRVGQEVPAAGLYRIFGAYGWPFKAPEYVTIEYIDRRREGGDLIGLKEYPGILIEERFFHESPRPDWLPPGWVIDPNGFIHGANEYGYDCH